MNVSGSSEALYSKQARVNMINKKSRIIIGDFQNRKCKIANEGF